MNDKDSRPSFSKNKIGKFPVGPTGITGTPGTDIYPTTELTMDEEGRYSASEQLFYNIDKLQSQLNLKIDEPVLTLPEEAEEIEEENWHDSSLDGLSEEEVIQNLSHHLDLDKKDLSARRINSNVTPYASALSPNLPPNLPLKVKTPVKDNFCRGCGIGFELEDRFCGNCGRPRV